MITVTINGKKTEVKEGTTIIKAAENLNIDIPVFCYHEGLSIAANCRMCLVEVELNGRKFPKPLPACHTVVQDGMVISTNSDKIKKVRKSVLEFLFLNHPIDCPICDQAGECYLQDHYMEHGGYDSRLDIEKVKKRKVVSLGKYMVLDSERCVLCSRCVRFTKEITKTEELGIFNRGNHSEISLVDGKELNNDYSICLADICPVGALTSKDFRFKKRVWYLKSVNSICTECSNGCNIFIDHEDGVVYRFRPRKNIDVNKWWICDNGRLSYKKINKNVLKYPLLNGKRSDFNKVYNDIIDTLKSYKNISNSIGVVISAHRSLENSYAIKKFFSKFLNVKDFYISSSSNGKSDGFLIKKDKNPNKKGVKYILNNLYKGDDILEAIKKHKILIFWGEELKEDENILKSKLKKLEKTILFSTSQNSLTNLVDITYPISNWGYQDGIFVNYEGRVQYFEAINENDISLYKPSKNGVIEQNFPNKGIKSEYLILTEIAKSLDFTFNYQSIYEIMDDIKKEYSEFNNISYEQIKKDSLLLEDK